MPEKGQRLRRFGNILAWAFFGSAVLLLAVWPLMIWLHANRGLPLAPAMLETMLYPVGAICFWIIARGLKLSTDLPPRG